MKPSPKFDIVVYGASGFTGRLVVEYFASRYRDSDIKWAMAGRSLDKLAAVRDAIGAPADTPLLSADAADPASLGAMLAQTSAVLTTVGPYQLYGSELVAACAASGTDYLDLCGEPVWMRRMIDTHHATAQSTGARIVFSCGFDPIPFELGVFFLQATAKAGNSAAPVSRVKGRVRKMKGTFSGGTAASVKATFAAAAKDLSLVALLKNPFALTPGFDGPKQPPGNKPLFDDDLGMWAAPFVMSTINTRNVHRSNFLMEFPYSRDFVYDEMMLAGPGEKGAAVAKAIVAANAEMGGPGGPQPGEGPSKQERETGFYDIGLLVGLAVDGRQVRVAVRGDRDPGYGSTSKMIAECAICLERDRPDLAGGIWTPGAAMGDRLIKRLVDNAGLTFEVEG